MENGASGRYTLLALRRVDKEIKQCQGRVPIRVLLLADMRVKVIPRKQTGAMYTAVQVRVCYFSNQTYLLMEDG